MEFCVPYLQLAQQDAEEGLPQGYMKSRLPLPAYIISVMRHKQKQEQYFLMIIPEEYRAITEQKQLPSVLSLTVGHSAEPLSWPMAILYCVCSTSDFSHKKTLSRSVWELLQCQQSASRAAAQNCREHTWIAQLQAWWYLFETRSDVRNAIKGWARPTVHLESFPLFSHYFKGKLMFSFMCLTVFITEHTSDSYFCYWRSRAQKICLEFRKSQKNSG